jgi:two-component system, OmpR family, response regulator VicR
MKATILYVEDDLTLSFVTRDNLQLSGYEVDYCGDGLTALEMIDKKSYDICIFDVMLPRMDGFTLATKIREKNKQVPILFLTARSAREDRLTGLRLGGDDYLTKPFSIEELVLKIEVFLRRSKIVTTDGSSTDTIRLGSLLFDVLNQQLTNGKKTTTLTLRENELLKFFALHQNQIIKREELLMQVWGNDHFFASRSLDVFISRLRKILQDEPQIILENIHNVGYRMKLKEQAPS